MDITSAQFVKGIKGTDDILYDGKRQILFVGRSNVGKSSLINSLVKRRALARSSSNPGKTVRLDFFLINNSFYFVDLPGYGYANMSKEHHEDIRKMMLWYLEFSEVKDRFVVVIVDANIGITNFDTEMIELLNEHKIPYVIVANKIDRMNAGEKERKLQNIRSNRENIPVIGYSTKTHEGRGALLKTLNIK